MRMRWVIFRIMRMFIKGVCLFIIILFFLWLNMNFFNSRGLILTLCYDINLALLHRGLLLIDQVLYRFLHFYLMLNAYTNSPLYVFIQLFYYCIYRPQPYAFRLSQYLTYEILATRIAEYITFKET
jgi:hypothetical protein